MVDKYYTAKPGALPAPGVSTYQTYTPKPPTTYTPVPTTFGGSYGSTGMGNVPAPPTPPVTAPPVPVPVPAPAPTPAPVPVKETVALEVQETRTVAGETMQKGEVVLVTKETYYTPKTTLSGKGTGEYDPHERYYYTDPKTGATYPVSEGGLFKESTAYQNTTSGPGMSVGTPKVDSSGGVPIDVSAQRTMQIQTKGDIIQHPGITTTQDKVPFDSPQYIQTSQAEAKRLGEIEWSKKSWAEQAAIIGVTTAVLAPIPGAGIAALPIGLGRVAVAGLAVGSAAELGKVATGDRSLGFVMSPQAPGYTAVLTSPEFVGSAVGGVVGFGVGGAIAKPFLPRSPIYVKQETFAKMDIEPTMLESGAREYAITGITRQKFVEGKPSRPVEITSIVKGKTTELASPEIVLADIPAGAKTKAPVPDQLVFKQPKQMAAEFPSTLKGKYEKTPFKVEQTADVSTVAGIKETQIKDFFDVRQKGYGAKYKQEVVRPAKAPGVTKVGEAQVKFDRYEIRPFTKSEPAVGKQPELKSFGEAETTWLTEDVALTRAKARYTRGKQDIIVESRQYTALAKPEQAPTKAPRDVMQMMPKSMLRPPKEMVKPSKAATEIPSMHARQVPLIETDLGAVPRTTTKSVTRMAILDSPVVEQKQVSRVTQRTEIRERLGQPTRSTLVEPEAMMQRKTTGEAVVPALRQTQTTQLQQRERTDLSLALAPAQATQQKQKMKIATVFATPSVPSMVSKTKKAPRAPPFIPTFRESLSTNIDKFKPRPVKQPSAYKPTAFALAFDIKGKEPKSISGLEPYRPVTKKWKKKMRGLI